MWTEQPELVRFDERTQAQHTFMVTAASCDRAPETFVARLCGEGLARNRDGSCLQYRHHQGVLLFHFGIATLVGTSSVPLLSVRLLVCADSVRRVTCNVPAIHVVTKADSVWRRSGSKRPECPPRTWRSMLVSPSCAT